MASRAFENVARPEHVARTIAFLASHRAAGHISGRCLRVTSDSKDEAIETKDEGPYQVEKAKRLAIHYPAASDIKMLQNMSKPSRRRVQIALSVDYDAISGWLGTGKHPDNNLADYSQGFFAGKIGAPRLLKLFAKLGVADKTTWFIPGHSMETFPNEVSQVVRSGCEIGLHGYCHEVQPLDPMLS